MFNKDEEFFLNQLNNIEESFKLKTNIDTDSDDYNYYYPSRLAIRKTLEDLKHQEIHNLVALDALKSKFLNEKKLYSRIPLGTSKSPNYLSSSFSQENLETLSKLNLNKDYSYSNQYYSPNIALNGINFDRNYTRNSRNLISQSRSVNELDDSLMLKKRPTYVKLKLPPISTIPIYHQFDELKKNQGQLTNRSNSRNTNVPLVSHRTYDPISGFNVFIDYLLNLGSNTKSARLVSCLHHPKFGLGEPIPLPIVKCNEFNSNEGRKRIALFGTKQPVPRCPPQQALTIIIELQINDKDQYISCGWTKIPLFDIDNKLLEGRWKLPIKQIPIDSNLPLSKLNEVQQYENVELFYRLVNSKDSLEETNTQVSPLNADSYDYPPQIIYYSNKRRFE